MMQGKITVLILNGNQIIRLAAPIDDCLIISITLPTQYLQWAELSFNPIVTGISLLVILSFSVFAISQPDDAKAEFVSWKNWIGVSFTWLYIGAMVSWPLCEV